VIVRELDEHEPRYTREDMFRDPAETQAYFDALDKTLLADNSFWRWIIHSLYPRSRRRQ
jgi:hypothetical protein